MNRYTTGQIVETQVNFYDDNLNPVDPTSLTLQYRCTDIPTVHLTYSGSSTPGVGYIFKEAVGQYQLNIDSTPLVGYLVWQWTPSGVGQTVISSSAIILPQPVI